MKFLCVVCVCFCAACKGGSACVHLARCIIKAEEKEGKSEGPRVQLQDDQAKERRREEVGL